MSIILADNEQRKGQALFNHGTLRVGSALRDRREQRLCFCMVPFGQATHSPDDERYVTVRSPIYQSTYFGDHIYLERGRLAVKFLARYPTGRLRTLETGESKFK